MNPNYKINHDVYTIANLFPMYEPHIHKLFNYLNGKINKLNICQYEVGYFNPVNFACFRYPNYVTIYIGSIIDKFYNGPDSFDDVMSAAAICVAHELYHADQLINIGEYSHNADYANNAENAAEYNAEVFCNAHKQEFKKLFGFNYVFGIQNDFGVYETLDESVVPKFIFGTFRSEKLYNTLNELIKKASNVGVRFFYNNQAYGYPIKANGKIDVNKDIVGELTKLLQVFKPTTSHYDYTMRTDVVFGDCKDFNPSDVAILDIYIDEVSIEPIKF